MEHKKLTILDKLHSNSNIYTEGSKFYEKFSLAQDNLGRISNFLFKKIKGKNILDFGCGTGKFIPLLSPFSKSYIAMDISESQLNIAKEKFKDDTKIKIIKNSIDKIPLKSNSIDIIYSIWVIGGIHDLKLRKKLIDELKRVVKNDGDIYLIENNFGGDYKKIVEEDYGKEKTNRKLKWLEKNGFEKVDKFKTYFEFENLESARTTFGEIFGKDIALKIKNKKLSHNIIIFKNGK